MSSFKCWGAAQAHHEVDGAHVSAQKLAQAQAEGRELMGPAQPAPQKDGRFSVEDLIGAACNVKRWIRRGAWKLAVSAGTAEIASATTN